VNVSEFLAEQLHALREAGLGTTIREIESPQDAWLQVDGRRVLNFCSNNYLGLANDPRLVRGAKAAVDRYGVGPGAVRTIAGTMSIHRELERRLAAFKGVPSVLSLQSGFTANLGVIPALVQDGDAVISDELNHASIVDGIRLSRGRRFIYRHCDLDDLRAKLTVAREGGARQLLVVTDGVFSMDGDIAPLPEIVAVADQFEAAVMVDDAHGEGVLGKQGRGIIDHFELHGRVAVEVGTMSKAFGVVGGYIAGSAALIEWLEQRARPFLFSSATTPADAAACIAAIDILGSTTDLVERLWANATRFKAALTEAGFDLGVSQTPICPVMLGDSKLAREFARRLFDSEGVFAQAISYPTVPVGTSRIRVMLSAAHRDADLERGAEAFIRVGRALDVIA
jgi:glycine C-acetyltransferase